MQQCTGGFLHGMIQENEGISMYEKGAHGLALANKLTETNDGRAVQEECTSWIRLAHTWLESLFAGDVEDGLHAQGREW